MFLAMLGLDLTARLLQLGQGYLAELIHIGQKHRILGVGFLGGQARQLEGFGWLAGH